MYNYLVQKKVLQKVKQKNAQYLCFVPFRKQFVFNKYVVVAFY